MTKKFSVDIGTQIHLVTVNDTNHHGTIFGGTVIELADKAAAICARRYCGNPVLTASLDRIDFLQPIFVGQEAHFTPRLLHAYHRSMQVAVEVKAVDPVQGLERKTAKILFTFVAIEPETLTPTQVPPWRGPETKESKAFRQRVLALRAGKSLDPDDLPKKMQYLGKDPAKPVRDSWVEDHHLVMPGDLNSLGLLFAGRYLSWVDISGSLAASRHTLCPVVTASIEEVHFGERVPKGSTIRLNAWPVFAAKTSVQIQVRGWLWGEGLGPDRRIADAVLTFVALDRKTGKPTLVPNLAPATAEENLAFRLGQWRYERRRS